MSKISTTFGLIALIAANEAFAQSKVSIQKTAQDLKVEFCDSSLAAKSIVGFQIGDNGIIQKAILGDNKCVTKVYSQSSQAEGKKLIVHKMSKYDEQSQGKLYEGTLKPSDSSSGDTTSGTTTTTFDGIKFEVSVVENRNGEPYKININVCHPKFKPYDPVSVTNRATMGSNQVVSKSTAVGQDRCFKTDYIKGEIQDGDVVGIGLYSVAKPIELTLVGVPWKRSQTSTPGGNTGSGNTGGGNSGGSSGNTGGGTTNPPTNPGATASQAEISSHARQAANRFAKNVAKTLGQIENIRYNMFLGFREEERRALRYGQNINDLNSVRQMRDYRDGYNVTSGNLSSGFAAGQSYAAQKAREFAQADVGAAIDAVIEGQASQVQISRRQNLGQSNFPGIEANLSVPDSFVQRLDKKDQEIQQDMSRYFDRDEELVLAEDILTGRFRANPIYSTQDYKFDLLQSYFRETRAFEAWANGYFQPRQSDTRYYRDISNPDLYQNASYNRSYYQTEFEREYDDVINREWNKVVRRERPEIQRASEELYSRIASSYARDMGYYEGQRVAHIEGSRRAYVQNVQAYYNAAVEETLRAAQNNAVIANTSVRIQNSNGSNEITIGETIDLVLTSAANRGMRPGQVQIAPVATNEVQVLKGSATQDMPALSKLRSPVLYKGMMFVSRVSQPDQQIVVKFSVNGVVYSGTLVSRFESLVAGLARSNGQNQKVMLNYVVQFLKAEWESKKAVMGDAFDNNKGDLLVERLAQRAVGMTSAERSVLRQYSNEIKAAYNNGQRPGMLSPFRGDFDSAMKILKRAGIE